MRWATMVLVVTWFFLSSRSVSPVGVLRAKEIVDERARGERRRSTDDDGDAGARRVELFAHLGFLVTHAADDENDEFGGFARGSV